MLSAFANPWVLLVVGALLVGTHGFAYVQGRSDGAAHERVECNARIDKANQLAEKQAEQWKEGLVAVIEANSKSAAEDDARNAELQKKIDEYEAQVLAGGGELCIINDDDRSKLQ